MTGGHLKAPRDQGGGAGRRWPGALLRAYPAGWRARYGGELEMLIDDLGDAGAGQVRLGADLLRGAAIAWLTDRRRPMHDNVRGRLLAVLWSWVIFAAIAAWFGLDAGEYPSISPAAGALARAHPALASAYDVLLWAGMAGLAATGAVAIPFAFAAVRDARTQRNRVTFALMAVPPVVATVWLAGLSVVHSAWPPGTGQAIALACWLLAGMAGIAVSTLAVSAIIRICTFSQRTWRLGAAAAVTVTAAMFTATGATLAWGLIILASPAPGQPAAGAVFWLTVTAVMALATARAAVAIGGLRQRQPAAR